MFFVYYIYICLYNYTYKYKIYVLFYFNNKKNKFLFAQKNTILKTILVLNSLGT